MKRFEGEKFWIERGRQMREHDAAISNEMRKPPSATTSCDQATLILEMEKKAIATLAHRHLPAAYLSIISDQCKLGPQRLLQEDTPESITLAACILMDRKKRMAAYNHLKQAARRGGVYAAYIYGSFLLNSAFLSDSEKEKAINLLFFAANGGCVAACRQISLHPKFFDWRGVELYYLRFRLTKVDKQRALYQTLYQQKGHSILASPLGFWIPDDALQTIVAPEITAAQRTWMLVAKRMHVPHGVAIIVADYICSLPYCDEVK
jgi:hypothetical protein